MILQKTHHAKKHNHTSRCISPEAYGGAAILIGGCEAKTHYESIADSMPRRYDPGRDWEVQVEYMGCSDPRSDAMPAIQEGVKGIGGSMPGLTSTGNPTPATDLAGAAPGAVLPWINGGKEKLKETY